MQGILGLLNTGLVDFEKYKNTQSTESPFNIGGLNNNPYKTEFNSKWKRKEVPGKSPSKMTWVKIATTSIVQSHNPVFPCSILLEPQKIGANDRLKFKLKMQTSKLEKKLAVLKIVIICNN